MLDGWVGTRRETFKALEEKIKLVIKIYRL